VRLSAQKMEGLLKCWALVLQEYTFDIVHHKGTQNTNADSLSRNPISTPHSVAVTSSHPVTTNIQVAQLEDPVIKQLHDGLSTLLLQ